MNNKCENCENEIHIQIRKNTGSCSLACDRAMGIGKYAERKEGKARKAKEAFAKAASGTPVIINVNNSQPVQKVVDKPVYFRQCTCGHPGSGCYCR